MTSAKVILDSITDEGVRITTLQLRFHRFILPEWNTHRVFSRNASSSRAVPFAKNLKNILSGIAYPVHWGENIPGMQAKTEIKRKKLAKLLWKGAAYTTVSFAYLLNKLGLHKQVVNRLLEPFTYTDVIVTSTQWANFFELRNHADADPNIKLLAEEIFKAYSESVPQKLSYGSWHLPYIREEEIQNVNLSDMQLVKMSVARCARVSYLTHDGKLPSIEKDLKLYNQLIVSRPLHASPAEHQVTPDRKKYIITMDKDNNTLFEGMAWEKPELHGNLTGVIQYRKTLMHEFIAG